MHHTLHNPLLLYFPLSVQPGHEEQFWKPTAVTDYSKVFYGPDPDYLDPNPGSTHEVNPLTDIDS